MHLVSLTLRRQGYSSQPDKPFEGTAQFQGSFGEISLRLNAEASQRVLAVVAEELVQASKDTADLLTKDTLEATSDCIALPAPVPAPPAAADTTPF